jgi:hypothetical protein
MKRYELIKLIYDDLYYRNEREAWNDFNWRTPAVEWVFNLPKDSYKIEEYRMKDVATLQNIVKIFVQFLDSKRETEYLLRFK